MISGPARDLVSILLVAIAIGGCCYGLYWRLQAGANQANVNNDQQILDLYRKLEQVEAVNDRLLERIAELEQSEPAK
tara:strand:- start:1986 stop:2216 length:231 start_codon:yes stop_codon:yes gene_type:complete